MCGISGIINKENNIIGNTELERMTNIISHRGPDSYGYYYGDNFALGHRRLAIIDLTDDGIQPMHYLERYTIVFNGEIYNYLELKNQLVNEGYSFKSTCDTEVILASYHKWGEACVNYFNGMWAFALFDKAKKKIFCSRDRFGVKPFYFVDLEDRFLFGSEIKQFFAGGQFKAKLNHQRAMDFLIYGVFDHTSETLFQGVNQLRGGYNLSYDLLKHKYNVYNWYTLSDNIKNESADFNSACEQFKHLFEDSLKLRLRSDVKVGSCLSGGLDSSAIVCGVNQVLNKQNEVYRQETVSSCSKIKKFDEQEYIDEVAEKTGITAHKVFPEFEELFDVLDKIIWHQDEPFGSTSIFAQWNVFKTAKENNLKVMLDGQGADEQLAGYHPFYGAYFAELLKSNCIQDFLNETHCLKRLHGYPNRHIFKMLTNSFLPAKLKKPLSVFIKRNKFKFLNVKLNTKMNAYGIHKNIRSLSLEQLINTSLPMLLHYEDRNSMAYSIEARVPFLDYRLVEFVLGLPSGYKIKDGKTKYILRQALKNLLPEKVVNRYDKMGFVTPEVIWIKENKELFRTELQKTCRNIPELINAQEALRWFDKYSNKADLFGDYTLWRLICLGRWIKVFNVSTSK